MIFTSCHYARVLKSSNFDKVKQHSGLDFFEIMKTVECDVILRPSFYRNTLYMRHAMCICVRMTLAFISAP
jgi:hypothetical protein